MAKETQMRRTSVACFAALLALGLSGAAQAADKVERAWQSKCASCHGDDGKAQTKKGKDMGVKDVTTAAWQKEYTDEKIKKGIEEGASIMKDGKKQEMEGYKDKLKPEIIDGLVKHMRSLAK
jgi:mono/diheme cytochrome c family protein